MFLQTVSRSVYSLATQRVMSVCIFNAMLELGYARWLRERGRGGRLNNTSAAARRVSFNFSSRFSFEAEEVHSRLPRHSLTNLLFTLRFAVLIGTPLCSSASRLLSFFFFLIFFFLLSFSFFFSLSLSQSRLDLSNLTFMHAHTTHNIV